MAKANISLGSRVSPTQWIFAAGVFSLLLFGAGWWLQRANQGSEMRELLNRFAPIATPPMEIQFSARQPDTAEFRDLLAPGIRAGYWIARKSAQAGLVEILLTSNGQKYFSTVGDLIVAGFVAGRRTVIKVDTIRNFGTSREISFHLIWTSIHPALSMLGEDTPVVGQIYQGEAILITKDGGWDVAHWSMPDFEKAQDKYR